MKLTPSVSTSYGDEAWGETVNKNFKGEESIEPQASGDRRPMSAIEQWTIASWPPASLRDQGKAAMIQSGVASYVTWAHALRIGLRDCNTRRLAQQTKTL